MEKFQWREIGNRTNARTGAKDDARIYARVCGPECQTGSFPDKTGKGKDRSKYLDSPLKRRVLAALDTLRHNAEMVDATGLEPVTPCV
jgi:hypothetical protein